MLTDYKEYIYHCLKCGACRSAFRVYGPTCPSGERFGFDSYYAIGRLTLARAILEERMVPDEKTALRIFSCVSCGACDEQCYPAMGLKPLKVIEEMKAILVESGKVPPKVRDFFENIQKFGNPYGETAEKRVNWMNGSQIKRFDRGDEYLLYVGCVGSYDTRSQKAAKSLAHMLSTAGVSFGVLGEKERCDGNEVLRLGEKDLFQYLAEENIKLFKELGVSKIVTLSPHSYNVFRNEYPALGGNFQVVHYTQFLADLLKRGQIKPAKKRTGKITYHDPCFLGRYNNEYEAPRTILTSMYGTKFVEMGSNKEHSFCCGGGGGNFYTEILSTASNSPARIRIREALTTGVDTLAVACPKCLAMLEDAVKAEDLEGKIQVADISELVEANC